VLNRLFYGPFFGQYKVPKYKELISKLEERLEDSSNRPCGWNDLCSVDVKMLDDISWIQSYISPCLKRFSDDIGVKINYQLDAGGWISCYNKGGFQESHQHFQDVSAVFIMNSGENFAQFYFLDRHSSDYPDAWLRKVFPQQECGSSMTAQDTYRPKLSTGDLILFPSHIYHGVSVHKSDIMRKTFAFNMYIHSVE
jgi:hypothetical protein